MPALRRAEQSLAEAEDCRAAFPRITRVRRTEAGVLELSFTDFAMERKVDVALSMAGGVWQGITLLHFPPHPEPFLPLKPPQAIPPKVLTLI